ncbi:MAG: hypothetical protein AB7J28_09835 [Hyphomonadaceae bacterium]
MPAASKDTADVAIIADLLDLAHTMARDLPATRDPSQAELLEALALALLCAQRLYIERTRRPR